MGFKRTFNHSQTGYYVSSLILSRYKVDYARNQTSAKEEKKGLKITLICQGRKVDRYLFFLKTNIFQAMFTSRGGHGISVPLVAGLTTSARESGVAVIDFINDIIVDAKLYCILLLVFKC